MEINVDSHIEPITYMSCCMDRRFVDFISNSENLASLVIQRIFKYYKILNRYRFRKIIVHIDAYQKYEALSFCDFTNTHNLVTVLTLTKEKYYHEKIIGKLLINEYMRKYYVRYKLDEKLSYLERIRIQCERIDELGKILKLIFRYRKNTLLPKLALNIILKKLCKEDANYAFLYVNPFSSKVLKKYIKNDEMKYIDDIEYVFVQSESGEESQYFQDLILNNRN